MTPISQNFDHTNQWSIQQHLRFCGQIRKEELINAFGLRVRTLRQKKGLTMETLAASANIGNRQLSDVELGKTNATISTALAIP